MSAAQRGVTPLTINTGSYTNSKTGLVAASATFRYDENSSATPRRRSSVSRRPGSRQQQSRSVTSPRRQRTQERTPTMNAYQNGPTAIPHAMFVRALYNYEADDRTSLSFRQGDIIQVINQLESGWWDGIHADIRGWFPSNYCAVIASPEEGNLDHGAQSTDEGESGTEEDEYEDPRATQYNAAVASQSSTRAGSRSHDVESQEEEAAFWIPQVTAEGRVFYYNTLTGVSTMDLPLEPPTSHNETGPQDRMNINAPDQARPPPEMMAGGYERNEDEEASASEVEDSMRKARNAQPRKRRSYVSDGVSPAASMESLNTSPVSRQRVGTRDFYQPAQAAAGGMSVPGVTVPSFTGNLLGQYSTSAVPHSFYDDWPAPPVTWNRLMENMRKSVKSYRQAISNCDRAEYVRKAENISDHLRMLLAAGSGTTDNHSGNPSVISTNKALYPHFRDMMSRFSKLVLSSHIAAADWPAPDSYSKCFQEAEGVLQGVYGYIEIARAQRGEEIPRLVPGFVLGSHAGGNWQSNNLGSRDAMASSSFMDQDDEAANEPSTNLDVKLLERMDDLKRMIVTGLRRLDEQLVVTEKVISPARHEQLSASICTAAVKVIENVRPCISLIESINLAPFSGLPQGQQLADFATHKQRMYDLTGSLVVACQTVAGPLSDEWADVRGEPLDQRMQEIRNLSKQLESSMTQMTFCLQGLVSSKQVEKPPPRETHRRNEISTDYSSRHMRNPSSNKAWPHGDGSFDGAVEPSTDTFREKPKLMQILGVSVQEEVPEYLRLDFESEIAWDKKAEPAQLKGGTLTALVEQLTRHDRLDTNFNNTFLLTYRSFTTASELFEMLVKRFTIQPPRGISQDNYRTWVDKKQKPIRFRVVNILKSWFDSYWMESKNDASIDLLRRVYSFAKDSVATSTTPGTGPLISVIEQRLKGHDPTPKRLVPNMNGQAPTPIVPKNMKKLKFLDIDPTEFARQLTIIEYSLYGKIKPTECLNKTWQKKLTDNEEDPAPNVKALILHSNQLTNWVAEMILAQNDVKRRGFVIKHFVSVADKCRQLNNFSTLTSIISALSTAPIHRLNRTWNQVNARTSSTLETMRRLMGSTKNFGEYRETLHSANPPCIPFFGVYLTDLTFIEDGIPGIIKKTDLINFAKRTKTAEVIRDIQQYQNVPYPLTPVKELQEYILNNMQAAGDVHEMYDRSLAVEPREREDEKIARYAKKNALYSSQGMALYAMGC